MFRALAIAAVLLLAALVTAPAYAQDAGGTANPPVDTTPPATPPTSDPAPAPTPAPTPTPDPNAPPAGQQPPSSDPSPPADPGGSQPATGPSDTGNKQPARPSSGDEFTTSTPASGSSTPAPSSTTGPSKDPNGSRGSDSWLGQDTFIVSKTATKRHDGATTVRRRFAGLFLLGASTQATRSEAKARRAHETAKVSPVGGSGPPKPGSPLPNQNPFFNLLSGPSGIAAGLMLASMLAVLGAAFVLPRDRLRAFRTPTVTWSPLAYVPPIELPG